MNPKRPTPRHIVIKVSKVKDKGRILKAVEQPVMHKGTAVRPSTDFSAKVAARRKWLDISLMQKLKKLPPKNTPPGSVIQNWREFSKQAKAKGVHHH